MKAQWDNSESPQFFHYGQKSLHMMKRMGYDFTKELGLNFGKGNGHCFVHLTERQRPRLLSQHPKRIRLCIYANLIRF